ncbi:hypothetical protein HK104_000312 [Borealophlyctis nickersoniae]|nr:hypothetical protein HK104_000312 [Borealophlyctis nickersoniae]
MSLHKELFKKPPLPVTHLPQAFIEQEENGAAPDAIAENPSSSPSQTRKTAHHKNCEPVSWNNYFESCRDVTIPNTDDTFRIYETRAALSRPLFIFHHGGGHTGLSWALVAHRLRTTIAEGASVLCFDCRGHGGTTCADETDLSLDRLSQDFVNVIGAVWPELPSEIILVGHSMGGAVVTDVASKSVVKNVLGTAVLDVVEGTAMESLAHMHTHLTSRPEYFSSLSDAINWSVHSMTVKNLESARVSVPPQLTASEPGKYVWRTDLFASEQYWEGWFRNLSAKFLSVRSGRLLVLAGTDRLDTPLMIGQMQGKFQLVIFPESGHTIQEDVPDKLASTLAEFWTRNQPLKIIKRFPIPAVTDKDKNKE